MVALIAAAVVVSLGRHYGGRLRRFGAHASAGAVILTTPCRYLREVVALQTCSYALRLAANAPFMRAVGIPVTPRPCC